MKLKKCILLLPIAYNDGTEVPAAVLSGILQSIEEKFDGYTIDGQPCTGVYKMEDGSKARDTTIKVWVAVEPEHVDEARTLAARFAGLLKQESLYFEVTEAEVEFVRPLTEIGEKP